MRYLVALVPILTSGCFVEDDNQVVVSGRSTDIEVVRASIETGERLEVEPGSGAGVFVEYHGEGLWNVFAGCDTDDPALACRWDVGVRTVDLVDGFDSKGLEPDDVVYATALDTLVMESTTSDTLDGFELRTTAGEPLRVEVWLDGEPNGRFLFWTGDGAVHQGAPSNPLDFLPTEP